MNVLPLHDRIVVRRLEDERMTAGGIVIPDAAAEKATRGDVIAVGSGRRLPDGSRQPLDIKVGDRVLFGRYAGTPVKISNEEVLVLREDDVLGIIGSAETVRVEP